MNQGFWSGKRVFITGHSGFKGSWLSLWLQNLGAVVIGYALNPATEPNLFSVADVGRRMRSIVGDIRDLGSLSSALKEANPEIVIHMAAQSLVHYSYREPVETYATNVMGTVHLLEAVRKVDSVRAVVVVTSDKCYDNKEWLWGYREFDSMGGYDPYSSSKGCSELVSLAYRNSFFNPAKYQEHGVAVASGRAGNVIGGGDWAADRLVPDIVRALAANEMVQIRRPGAIRPWQHVLEPLSGYLTLAERLYTEGASFAEAWNFGPADEDAKSVKWIVERLLQKWGHDAQGWNLDIGQQPHEAHYLKLDCSKARERLQWAPRWNLAMALDRIVDWHKALLREEDMLNFTLQQIAEYGKATVM